MVFTVVVLVVVAVGAVVVRQVTSDSNNSGSGSTGANEESPAGGSYAARDGVCAAVDLSPVEALVPITGTGTDEESDIIDVWLAQCGYYLGHGDEEYWGSFDFDATVYPDAQSAKGSWDRYSGETAQFFDRSAPAQGPWQEGLTHVRDNSDERSTSVSVRTDVVDGNLEVSVKLHILTDPGVELEPDMRAALDQIVVNLMETLSA